MAAVEEEEREAKEKQKKAEEEEESAAAKAWGQLQNQAMDDAFAILQTML